MQQLSYFAIDGSYGDATDIIIVSTDSFTDADWEDIANASDSERSELVEQILYFQGMQTKE